VRLRVIISWPNAGSPLLPDDGAGIDVLADGRRLSPTQVARGQRVFEIPDGAAKVRLVASFRANFGAVPGTDATEAVEAEVLHIDQTYSVKDGTQLEPDFIPAFAGPHPLAVVKGLAGVKGAASIVLRTEFVDISPFWPKYATNWSEYVKDQTKENGHRENRTFLLPIGYTGGSPLIWFASFPKTCMTSTNNEVSCLVFFRPVNHYTYTKIDQQHEMTGLMRYLLAPTHDAENTPDWWKLDHMTWDANMWGRNLIRCGFENALATGKRAVVMLHPWPSGADYGLAVTNQLPSMCESAIRYLWSRAVHWIGDEEANHFICKNVGNVRLGRLGISAFSAGGVALWKALGANSRRVDELYVFDCNGTPAHGGLIAQWFTADKRDKRLRMVGGAYNVGPNRAVLKTIGDIDGIRGARPNVTLALDGEWFKAGTIDYWDHAIGEVPDFRHDIDTKHQFVIFGGDYASKPDPTKRLPEVETFLANFIANSAFNSA
jgi:hypothetical protein